MAQISEMIMSEINYMEGISDKMKSFLKWILEFERLNSDKPHAYYKPEIEKKLNDLLIDASK